MRRFYPPARCKARRPLPLARGFTLQEMMVALCIAGLVIAGSFGIWRAIRRNTIVVAANELLGQLTLARTEAIRRHMRVMMCPSDGGGHCLQPDGDFTSWQHGWLIYADRNGNAEPDDGEIAHRQAETHDGVLIRSTRTRHRVIYQPSGTSGGSTTTIAVCDEDDPTLARYIIVSNGGRARITRTTTSKVKCE